MDCVVGCEVERIHFRRMFSNAVLPTCATPGAVVLDLSTIEACIVQPNENIVVKTGWFASLQRDIYARFAPPMQIGCQK